MTKREKDLERLHVLATVAEYPNLSTSEVRDRANSECQHDIFDPLPFVSAQGITPKLNSLSLAGLVTAWQDGGELRWEPTDKGRGEVQRFLATLEVEEATARPAEAAAFQDKHEPQEGS